MKLISWNVNGLRAVMKKDFEGIFEAMDTDVLCLQETKMQAGQLDYDPEGYYAYYNYAEKKGYSGTAVYTRIKPLNVTYGIQEDEHNTEGRVITCEYDDFFLVCVYTPNSQPELKRIDYRMQWEDDFREYLKMLDETKPVVLCGDLNVAHKEIDLKNPSANRKNPGFSDQEREQFTNLLDAGFIDSFRELHPNAIDRYSWWSYRANARSRNIGWRIDYFVVSERLRNAIEAADILDQVLGSDHCPVMIKLNF
ncbi:exodeoxyribonuclease III [Erysipelothrix rhusiopathiae]|uniref:exodeoxyribonuclease III n=1 Tax=Erysipelothrix rhusiopathiae TaxID=1648 RepID=UPI000210B7A3|nr:exodeoxyribonuclease III [Erysipelothrix rhusiopathiae]AGN24945.1 exodeoxyribonuclease III [Erysipelothrix rhusiopathiae SY1027]AMS10325.1 exodeoxyribonuclease III [Erysipelothrix rhusiopathiae]AOO67334.1 exodeoxyribonuclease III [Erysipelothrix rhusiopathiae]AWU42311.1 exodeoxyribonuclease III [Erysipelothrix rhusiopathiae]MCG4436075.1 exodeoxyribonuclease III [Erysipelothrix rhusiopathiae]